MNRKSFSVRCVMLLLALSFTVHSAAAEPADATLSRPNVLFIAVDDLNDWVGCMGGNPDAKTPNIDRFAKRSVLFDNAHCQVALCSASRSSVLTGLYPTSTGIFGNSTKSATDAYRNAKQMPVWFRDNGYQTACMGKIYHNDHGKKAYWDEIGPKTLRWGPEPPGGRQFASRFGERAEDSLAWAALDIAPGEMPDEQIATWGKQQLDKQRDQPFFLALGFYKPHTPMTAPKRYFDLFDRQKLALPIIPENDLDDVPEIGRRWVLDRQPLIADDAVDQYSPTYRRELVHAYHACVALTDDCVGQVLRHLENSPHADNTIVVLWSDHGWHLGEKQHWRKWMPWEESTRSIVAVHVPNGTGNGSVCHRTVGLIDIYPTLAKLCGIEAPAQLQGQSFDHLLSNPEADWERPAITATKEGNYTVRSERWRYIRYSDGSEELYDHRDDPNEWTNLAGKPEYTEVKAEHGRWIDKLTKNGTDVDDPKPKSKLRSKPETKRSKRRVTSPNVIMIMSDDQGWGDVGFNGNTNINTPNLDAMAANGVRFDRFYAAAPLCSPTRGSCLTGRYPFRFGILAAHTAGMRVGEITVAEMLKDQDYRTGFFGKWHMGWVKPEDAGSRGFSSPPDLHGFDEYFATTSAVPTWNPTVTPDGWNSWGAKPGDPWKGGAPYVQDGKEVTENMQGDDSRIIMDRVIPFVEANRDQPFFATVWFHAPHEPVVAGEEYRKPYAKFGKSRQNLYGCITAMDEQIGRLRQKLRELEIEESTVLFFCSDNGPSDQATKKGIASAGPFKGHKHTMYEGGLLVPGCAEWPGTIPAGSATSTRCATVDFFPTIANIVGYQLSKNNQQPIDGIDLMPVIMGEVPERSADLFFGFRRLHEGIDGQAIISGDWKLLREAKRGGAVRLYNLKQDPFEQADLFRDEPQQVQQLQQKLLEFDSSCQLSRDGADYRY